MYVTSGILDVLIVVLKDAKLLQVHSHIYLRIFCSCFYMSTERYKLDCSHNFENLPSFKYIKPNTPVSRVWVNSRYQINLEHENVGHVPSYHISQCRNKTVIDFINKN